MHTVANVYSGAGMMSLYSSWHHTGSLDKNPIGFYPWLFGLLIAKNKLYNQQKFMILACFVQYFHR